LEEVEDKSLRLKKRLGGTLETCDCDTSADGIAIGAGGGKDAPASIVPQNVRNEGEAAYDDVLACNEISRTGGIELDECTREVTMQFARIGQTQTGKIFLAGAADKLVEKKRVDFLPAETTAEAIG
jgi:hypothetical protein